VLILTNVPDTDGLEPGVGWDGPLYWAGLDCADELRRARLEARGWNEEWIDDAMVDAKNLRTLIDTRFTTDDQDTTASATAILAWVERHQTG
jgi:hypothetical protein